MKTFVYNGIMYATAEPGDAIHREPTQIRQHALTPGDIIKRIGSKGRTSFSPTAPFMFVGRCGDLLLSTFSITEDAEETGDPHHYIALYILERYPMDPETKLALGGWKGVMDIVPDTIEWVSHAV